MYIARVKTLKSTCFAFTFHHVSCLPVTQATRFPLSQTEARRVLLVKFLKVAFSAFMQFSMISVALFFQQSRIKSYRAWPKRARNLSRALMPPRRQVKPVSDMFQMNIPRSK